jgi:hypothetical protein
MKTFRQFLDEGIMKTAADVILHPIKTLIKNPIQNYSRKLDSRDKKLDKALNGPK